MKKILFSSTPYINTMQSLFIKLLTSKLTCELFNRWLIGINDWSLIIYPEDYLTRKFKIWWIRPLVKQYLERRKHFLFTLKGSQTDSLLRKIPFVLALSRSITPRDLRLLSFLKQTPLFFYPPFLSSSPSLL